MVSELALLRFGGFRFTGFVLQDVFASILVGVNSDDAVNDLGHCSCVVSLRFVKQVLLPAKILDRCYIIEARTTMETHDTNRLVAVTFEPEESPSPPQTPRRLRPAPQQPAAVIAHQIAVEDDERRFAQSTTWRSCCVTVDRRAVSYFGQLGFALLVIVFCIVQLSRDSDCATWAKYSPVLMLVIGAMLPSPKLHD